MEKMLTHCFNPIGQRILNIASMDAESSFQTTGLEVK